MTQVMLVSVKTGQEKLEKIAQISSRYFYQKEPILLLVENDIAADYIDKLLWKMPPDSFLPHSAELITISTFPQKEINHYFNLTPQPLLSVAHGTIYEFDDQTSPLKAEGCKRRYHAYKQAGFSIAQFIP